ncbi:hypothetical protein J6590_002975 [Homalodisca vitripennis]|nr:hypothetical protein J6590_002975 [Homalodisca vitripennis]
MARITITEFQRLAISTPCLISAKSLKQQEARSDQPQQRRPIQECLTINSFDNSDSIIHSWLPVIRSGCGDRQYDVKTRESFEDVIANATEHTPARRLKVIGTHSPEIMFHLRGHAS